MNKANGKKQTLFYKKVGRRYEPVSEYDSEYCDSYPKGSHLVVCKPGSTMRMFNVDPDLVPMIAAGTYAIDDISKSIQQATELRPVNREMTEQDHQRWLDFIKTMPDDMRFMMTHGSARDAAEAGVKAMIKETERLMSNPAVRKAYDRFMLVCQLTKEKEFHSDK